MRCYFLIDGHIAGIEMLTGLSDRDAVTKARLLFSERRIPFDGYEVWDQTRFVFRHPHNPYVETPAPIGRGRQPPLTMTEHVETRLLLARLATRLRLHRSASARGDRAGRSRRRRRLEGAALLAHVHVDGADTSQFHPPKTRRPREGSSAKAEAAACGGCAELRLRRPEPLHDVFSEGDGADAAPVAAGVCMTVAGAAGWKKPRMSVL